MCKILRNTRNWSGPGIFLALLFSCNIASSQNYYHGDTINKISPAVIKKIRENLVIYPNDFLFKMSPSPGLSWDKNHLFFDSLKVRASKNNLTRKLYSFLVINRDTLFKKHFTGTSDAGYQSYTGKKIRKIIVKRLNVFGANVYSPDSLNPNKIENILNRTHFNTNESIIRKNLIFSVGQTISPLVLSDNERLLRQLPYIDDARIVVDPVSDEEADIIVYTKDVYSLGGSFTYHGLKRGDVSIFDKNIFGMGHEFGLDIPYNSTLPDSPGFGVHYAADNIAKSFINLNVYYLHGLGEKTYGFALSRKLVSFTTKYAGGISIREMFTSSTLDTLTIPAPLKYNLQDYWLSRSFLVNKESISRLIIGVRYTNNNVFDHPVILPESFYNLQRYKIFLASVAWSVQKYTKTNLIYSYGRTEDVPYGMLAKFTTGREFNEFKQRTYLGSELSFSKSVESLGYFYSYTGFSTYLNRDKTEQGILSLGLNYFSNLVNAGNSKIRNFVYVSYVRGFGRYTNENLRFITNNGFSGFSNDSINGTQRLTLSLESVLFSPINPYGFRFAFFGFADFSFLSATNQIVGHGYSLSSIGVGIRVRNDNLVFNTLQLRIGYYPNYPPYSTISPVTFSGEQLLHPANFEPGAPAIIPYR